MRGTKQCRRLIIIQYWIFLLDHSALEVLGVVAHLPLGNFEQSESESRAWIMPMEFVPHGELFTRKIS